MTDRTEEQKAQIQRQIVRILWEKLSCPCQNTEQNPDAPLTGRPFLLTEVEMIYLLFEIEKQFGIRIGEEKLLEYGFSTVNRITELVAESLPEAND